MDEVPEVLSRELKYDGYFNVCVDSLKRNDLKLFYHIVITHCDAAVILAQDKEGRLIINREYRHPVEKYIFSTPGGTVEKNEDPQMGAQRELLEETGYLTKELQLLGTSYPMPAICNQKIYYYFAKNAEKVQEPDQDPFEFMTTELYKMEDFEEEVRKGAEIDGVLCTALYFLKLLQ